MSDDTAVGNPDLIRAFRYTFGPPAGPGEVGTLGPYRVVKQLGRGGMGAVYAALDTRLDRRLALKVMLPECAADADAKERFLREARAAAQVAHDNVVTVYEADERDGVPYIAMQYLEGYPLDEFLKRKGCPTVPQVLRIVRETAAGLAAAHKMGLVHRDIKPGNLWLEAPGGRVKVLDFGLARPVHAATELTQSGTVVGTPAYMSPEQARGMSVDARSDLFSLGAVMYRLFTGRLPFEGPTTMAVLMALGTEEPVPVRERNPAVPEPVAALVHQLLAKAPNDRPPSAAEVVKRVQAIAQGTGASQVVVTPAARVVYVPIHVTAVAAVNPFTDLDATVAEPVPQAPVATPDACPASPPAPRPRKKPRHSWLWPAVGSAVALALAAVGAVIVVKNKDGSEAKIEVPDGVTVKATGKNLKTVPAVGPKPAAIEADRIAAERVLALGGLVEVDGTKRFVRSADEVPRDRYTLTGVNLSDRPVVDDDLALLKDCKGLTCLFLHVTRVTDAGLIHLKDFPGLQILSLTGTELTDAGAAQLKQHPELTILHLTGTKVTDAGLAHLKELPCLRDLLLDETRVTDAGLAHIKGMARLENLAVCGTKVTDAGLAHLAGHPSLKQLRLTSTAVTDAGVSELKRALPECKIER